jgi:lysophospholipase L1-like esterase
MKRLLLIPLLAVYASSFQEQSHPISVFMIGDSTMAEKDPQTEPERGWGQMLQSFFKDSAKVFNHARNGRSSKSFIEEGLWQAVMEKLHPGDYVVIQFGHNDQKPDAARHTDPLSTYKSNLQKFIDDTRAKGAYPIVCTSIVRRKFDDAGNIADTHGEYPVVARMVALESHVPLLDLQVRTQKLVSDLGPEKSKSIYLYVARGAYPNRPDGVQDDTHLNIEGATAVARMAVEEIRAMKLPLAEYLQEVPAKPFGRSRD